MKNKKKKVFQEFPNIFRFIPEEIVKRYLIKTEKILNSLSIISVFINIILILLFIFTAFSLYKNLNNLFTLNKERESIVIKRNYWKSISEKYESYKDAYFQYAVKEYELGNYTNAEILNSKVLLLDPGFEDAKKLEEVIKRK